MSEERDRRDKALDEALASYVESPDNDGLGIRILARVAERRRSERRNRKLSLMAAIAAMALGCLLWQRNPGPSVHTAAARGIALVSTNRMASSGPNVTTPVVEVMARARRQKRPVKPKLPEFPSKYQVGGKERALLQLAAFMAKNAVRESQYIGIPVRPIELVALEIRPIE